MKFTAWLEAASPQVSPLKRTSKQPPQRLTRPKCQLSKEHQRPSTTSAIDITHLLQSCCHDIVPSNTISALPFIYKLTKCLGATPVSRRPTLWLAAKFPTHSKVPPVYTLAHELETSIWTDLVHGHDGGLDLRQDLRAVLQRATLVQQHLLAVAQLAGHHLGALLRVLHRTRGEN